MLACVDLRVSICVCRFVCGKFGKSVRRSRFLFSVKQSCRARPASRHKNIRIVQQEGASQKIIERWHRAVVLYHWTRESSNSLDANSASSRGSNVVWHDAGLLDVRRWCAKVSRALVSNRVWCAECFWRVMIASVNARRPVLSDSQAPV